MSVRMYAVPVSGTVSRVEVGETWVQFWVEGDDIRHFAGRGELLEID